MGAALGCVCALCVGWLTSRRAVIARVLSPRFGLGLGVACALMHVQAPLVCVAWSLCFVLGRRLHCVGLTGGVGTGKSSVSRVLREERGAVVIDADVIAREVVEPGKPAHAAIVKAFGPGVLLPDGTLDREALGKQVFADPAKRRAINAATHSRIGVEILKALAWHRWILGQPVVLDAPLLLENPLLRSLCHPVVVVWCDEEVEVRRVMARDACDEGAAKAKVGAQWSMARKKQLADRLLDNNGTRDQLRERALQLWDAIVDG